MDRPKVRFSQTSETVSQNNKVDINTLSNKGRVKVKSIVPINFPIKVLKNGKRVLVKQPKNLNSYSGNSVHDSKYVTDSNDRVSTLPILVSEVDDDTFSESRELSILSGSGISTDENSTTDYCCQTEEDIRHDNYSEINTCTDKLRTMTIKHSVNNVSTRNINENKSSEIVSNKSNKSSKINIPLITCDSSDENSDIEILEIINNSKKPNHPQKNNSKDKHKSKSNWNKSSNICTKDVEETKSRINNEPFKTSLKENKENYSKSIMTNKIQSKFLSNPTVLTDTTNAYSKVYKNIPIKKLTRTQNKLQVMPCAKFKLASLTNKNFESSQIQLVQKSTVLQVTGNPCKVSVEPETLHKQYDSDNELEINGRSNVTSKDLLSRPEYNSTICVIKKLKEIEKEKLINDVEHLPTAYKSFINGKVSAALDFAPYETVYKDLINLSIADDKLPARLMRSKDPEPRNKDIVPKLSDFYNPKYTEQYFTVVNPSIINPVSVNTLSAFTISNKICTWKLCRDNY